MLNSNEHLGKAALEWAARMKLLTLVGGVRREGPGRSGAIITTACGGNV